MENFLVKIGTEAVSELYGAEIEKDLIQVQLTRKEFKGDYTLVVFPLLRFSRKSPELTAEDLGSFITARHKEFESYNVVKGFLNLSLSGQVFVELARSLKEGLLSGISRPAKEEQIVMIEYSSPNTNKPLHLGHIRNNLLGFSLSRILSYSGNKVYKTNIVNDRGIHICKSMLAWQKFGNGETPQSTGEKGDHLVGRYYVKFDVEYKKQQAGLIKNGMRAEEAAEKAGLIIEAREMLRKWENGDAETVELWEKMNSWVYKGFDETYRALGVDFDRIYYESDTYRLGRDIVLEAVEKGLLEKKDDGSVWADFTSEGLDQKLLLRSDGTAVYMTQDLGTAIERHRDYNFDSHYYVVGNEQNYHFQILKLLLLKLGYKWADSLYHFSYGMVELPEGKMKSREGKVVDADDLLEEMINTARTTSDELGKLDDYPDEEKREIFRKVGLGALKYFILKVDPKKNMTFNPAESIDFNGNTGPFIQYTYARINSIMRKAGDEDTELSVEVKTNIKEQSIILSLSRFENVVAEAARSLSPAMIANYCYDLARDFNQFYHDYSILGEEDILLRKFRIAITGLTGRVLEKAMWLLGIDMPERM